MQTANNLTIIQVNFQQLETLGFEYQDYTQRVQSYYGELTDHLNHLQNEQWTGNAADLFYLTLQQDVLPAISRLVLALQNTEQIFFNLSDLYQQADEEASSCLKLSSIDENSRQIWFSRETPPVAPPQQGQNDGERIQKLIDEMQNRDLSDEEFAELMNLIQNQERLPNGNPQNWADERQAIHDYLDREFTEAFGDGSIENIELTDENIDLFLEFGRNYLIVEATLPDENTAVEILWHTTDNNYASQAMTTIDETMAFVGGWGPSDGDQTMYDPDLTTVTGYTVRGSVLDFDEYSAVCKPQDDMCMATMESQQDKVRFGPYFFWQDLDQQNLRMSGDIFSTYIEENGHSWQEFLFETEGGTTPIVTNELLNEDVQVRNPTSYADSLFWGAGKEYQVKSYILNLHESGYIELSDEQLSQLSGDIQPGGYAYPDPEEVEAGEIGGVPPYPAPEGWPNPDGWPIPNLD